jgi:hypothetical protein
MFEYDAARVSSIEYSDGVLIITYAVPRNPEDSLITKMVPWEKVQSIYWDGPDIPSRIPFPDNESLGSHVIS